MLEQAAFNTKFKNGGGRRTAALYCRLSRDDDQVGDSNSIVHQKEILGNYAEKHGFTDCRYYIDDGYSGTNFDRPDFKRMMTDIENGEIGTVIVKDMSRFGRNYIMVGYYTEILFPNAQIRFIAVSDGVDSSCEYDNEFTPFRNIINEWYARDTSKKVKAVIRAKGMAGKHLAAVPPYGYMKDPDDKTKWIIDEEAAEVVKRIYKMYLSGMLAKQIARQLTQENVDTPLNHNIKCGLPVRTKSLTASIWNTGVIYHILGCYDYTGCTVNFKTTKPSYKSMKMRFNDREDWVIFENTQEAIIDKDTFELVQKMRESRRVFPKNTDGRVRNKGVYKHRTNKYLGKAFCADCGGKMILNSNGREDYLVCSTYRKKVRGCTSHSIRLATLDKIISAELKKICAYAKKHEKEFVERYLNCSEREKAKAIASVKSALQKANARNDELNTIIRKLYEDKALCKITDEQYEIFSENYIAEQKKLKVTISRLEKRLNDVREDEENLDNFLRLLDKYTEFDELNQEIIYAFVERIEISEKKRYSQTGQKIKIVYNFVGAVDIPQE